MIPGSCLCGTVRFEVAGPYQWFANCHCSMCRKHHGAMHGTTLGAEKANFRWLAGEADIVHYQSSSAFERPFCRHCGSKVPSIMGDHVIVPAGTLQDDPGARLQAHIFVKSKSPMWEITDSLPQFDDYPPGFENMVATPTKTAATQPSGALTGSCLCGEVAYRLLETPTKIALCHCTRCQRSRGTAYAVNTFVRRENLEWTRGAELVRTYKVPEAQLFGTAFCARCGSLLPALFAGIKRYNIPLGSLDTPLDARPRLHIHVQSRAPWHTITDALPQFDEMPPRDQVKELMF
jgi:hypothetical protein